MALSGIRGPVTRVMLCAFGSAGDLFPLVSVARQVEEAGHDIVFAAPRSLGLYLRSVGLRCYALGSGAEFSVVNDGALFSTRFDGWASNRRTFVHYVGSTLAADMETVRRVVDDWQPDVMVTMNLAVAARVVALSDGVAHVAFSVSPDLFRLRDRGMNFAKEFQRAIGSATPTAVIDDHGFEMVAWGVGPDVTMLHDPVLLSESDVRGGASIVGYPYWDALPTTEDPQRTYDWIDASRKPVVAVTLGSFIGLVRDGWWHETLNAARSCNVRLLAVNAPLKSVGSRFEGNRDVLAVGFLPLSPLLPRVDAVIHHGGLGTTFAAIGAGRPAVVVPQAFDQTYVAAQLERAGLGVSTSTTELESALRVALESPDMRASTAAAAGRRIPPAVAAERAAERVLRVRPPGGFASPTGVTT